MLIVLIAAVSYINGINFDFSVERVQLMLQFIYWFLLPDVSVSVAVAVSANVLVSIYLNVFFCFFVFTVLIAVVFLCPTIAVIVLTSSSSLLIPPLSHVCLIV